MAAMTSHIPSTWKRAGARILDFIFLTIITSSVLAAAPVNGEGWIILTIPVALGLSLMPLIYETLFFYFCHATPGKWIFKLRLESAHRGPTQSWFWQSLLRAASSYLTFFFSWALYATALWRYDRRHWLDLWAETRVVGPDPGGPMKRRLISGLVLVILGLDYGWSEATSSLHSIQIHNGYILVPGAQEFEMAFDDFE